MAENAEITQGTVNNYRDDGAEVLITASSNRCGKK